MLKKDNCADLCPAKVYEELDRCPKCCNCFPLAEKVIQGAAEEFRQDVPVVFHGTSPAYKERTASVRNPNVLET